MKFVKKLVPRKVVNSLEKLGPVKCAAAGVFFYIAEKALIPKAVYEAHQGDLLETAIYGSAAAFSFFAGPIFLLVGDGYIPIKNAYKKFKKKQRGIRIYNSWKYNPSYKTLEQTIDNSGKVA